jgi:hypothetical protein
MTDVEKAYLAGIIDSRCYIGTRTRNGKQEPQMEICRELMVLEKIRQLIGGGIQPYKNGYRFRLRGAAVDRVMLQVKPFMLT